MNPVDKDYTEKLKKEAEIVVGNISAMKVTNNNLELYKNEKGSSETIEEFCEKTKKCIEGGLSFSL